MSKLKEKLALLLVLILAFGVFASGCGLIEKTPEAIDKQNVAKVGNEYITRGELDKEFELVLKQMKAQYGENFGSSESDKSMIESQKRSYLDSLVESKIIYQNAMELKLFKDDNEINSETKKFIDEQLKASNTTEDQLNEQLEKSKLTREEFEKSVREQYTVPEKVFKYVTKDITVSDDEIKTYYDENKVHFTEKPNTMEVSHIVVNTEDEAKEVKAELDKGADFATLAKEKSTEPAAKESGGSLGEIQYYDPGYDATFVQAAMELKEGQLSDPVQTQFGFHIIKVTKKTEYPILPFDEVKDKIKDELLNQKQAKEYYDTLTEWKDKAGIKIYEENISNEE